MRRGLERRHLTQTGDRRDDRPRVSAEYDYSRGDSTHDQSGWGAQHLQAGPLCATTVDEVSPPGDSAANGVAARAISTIGGLVRTTKAVVLESSLAGRHAAQVLNACSVGTDGLTPLLHSKERKFGTPLAGFL